MKRFFLFFFLYHVFFMAVAKDDLPDKPRRLVSDMAGILHPDQVHFLERKLLTYEDTTSTQIAILIEKKVPGDYDYSDYAERVAEKWAIGQKDKDNGVLLYVAVDDRRVWIATGYGMESSIPDAVAKTIIDQVIAPEFKREDYFRGLDKATSALMLAASGEFEAAPGKRDKGGSLLVVLLVILVLILFSWLNRNSGGGGNHTTYSGRGYHRGGYYGGFGGGFGGGRSSGGGGFGGFGGGGFGGGGAGGSW